MLKKRGDAVTLRHHYPKIGISIVIFIILIATLFIQTFAQSEIKSDDVRGFILGYGVFSPIAYFILKFLQVMFPVIPGQVMETISGYLFGAVFGAIYSYTASVLASLLLFKIARKYGLRITKMFVCEKDLQHLRSFIMKKGAAGIIVARLVPFFPTDAINFVAGISKISYKKFIIGTLIGSAPGIIIFSLFGSRLALQTIDLELIVLMLIISALGVLYIFRHQIRVLFIKKFLAFEKKIQKK